MPADLCENQPPPVTLQRQTRKARHDIAALVGMLQHVCKAGFFFRFFGLFVGLPAASCIAVYGQSELSDCLTAPGEGHMPPGDRDGPKCRPRDCFYMDSFVVSMQALALTPRADLSPVIPTRLYVPQLRLP